MLEDSARIEHLRSLGLSQHAIEEFERIRKGCPSRKVGEHARRNVWSKIPTDYGKGLEQTESKGVEAVFLRNAILFWKPLEIYTQPQMSRVEFYSSSGRRSVTTVTNDFLTVDNQVTFWECKTLTELQACVDRGTAGWEFDGKNFRRPPLENWARRWGFFYAIWSPPEPVAFFEANLQLVYAYRPSIQGDHRRQVEERILRYVTQKPGVLPIAELIAAVPGYTLVDLCSLLAKQRLHGTLKSAEIGNENAFLVGVCAEQVSEIDSQRLKDIQRAAQPISVNSPLALASPTDLKKARERAERIARMRAGLEPTTSKFKRLIRAVTTAEARDESVLQACLTNYANSGNRASRLTELQEQAIAWAINEPSPKGIERNVSTVRAAVIEYLVDRGCNDIPSYEAVRQRWLRQDQDRLSIQTGGARRYHKTRAPTPPPSRFLDATVALTRVHVDACRVDCRATFGDPDGPFAIRPTIYRAVCAKTEMPVGQSVNLGNSCREGVGRLLDDIRRRWGVLPLVLVVDRGPELRARYLEKIAAFYGIEIEVRPASGPQWGGEVEQLMAHTSRFEHELPGSTLPDRAGRSVSGAFKSYETARLGIRLLLSALEEYMFKVLPEQPATNGCPNKRETFESDIARHGLCGRQITDLEEFKLRIAVPRDNEITLERTKGMRFRGRNYTSLELTRAIDRGERLNRYIDACDPFLAYAQPRNGGPWIKAWANDWLRARQLSHLDLLIEAVVTEFESKARRLRQESHSVARRRLAKRVIDQTLEPQRPHEAPQDVSVAVGLAPNAGKGIENHETAETPPLKTSSTPADRAQIAREARIISPINADDLWARDKPKG